MKIFVTHEGHRFTTTEMTVAGEKHERDVSLFHAIGPPALDRITLENAERVFAMLWCYYNFPVLRTNILFSDYCPTDAAPPDLGNKKNGAKKKRGNPYY